MQRLVLLLLFAPAVAAQGPVNASILAARPDAEAQLARRQTPVDAAVQSRQDAVVHVAVWVEGRNRFKIERPSSGVVVDAGGLVITHEDLVREVRKPGDKHRLEVRLRDGSSFPAEVLAVDDATGLACLRFAPGDKPLTCFELADTGRMFQGELATVLSDHEGKDRLVFSGVLARASGGVQLDGRRLAAEDILVTDAAIERTSHGAALIDANGRLIGLCNASRVGADLREPTLADLRKPSFGFALPAHAIRKAFGKTFRDAGAKNATLLAPPAADAIQDARRQAFVAAAVAKVQDSIVGVFAGAGERPAVGDDDPLAMRRRPGLGSGVVVDTTGLILTNAHLVEDGAKVRVTFADGKVCDAEVLERQANVNLALLKAKLPAGAKVRAIELGDSTEVLPGETVVGIGRPYGKELTLSAGILSASRSTRAVELGEQKETGVWLQADANLADHNGGGALVDATGRLLGIVDGGRVDRLEIVAAQSEMERDTAKIDTSLSFVLGVNRIRRLFQTSFDAHAGANKSVAEPVAATKEQLALRRTPVAEVVEKTAGSLVNVYVSWTSKEAQAQDNPFADAAEARTFTRGLGSGVIITRDGLAITNWHVVDDATEPTGAPRADHVVHVGLRSGKKYQADVLSISREDDLALLALRLEPGETVDAVELGDSDDLRIGETAIAIGNPHGQQNTATAGVVTAKDQKINIKGRWDKFDGLVKTDAAINAGNSGGALLDINGELIGINSAGGGGRNVTGYAIPVNYVRDKIHGVLLTPKKLRSIFTGMEVGDADGHPVVRSVHRHGPAERAGIAAGDALLALDGGELTWSVGLKVALLRKSAAEKLRFTVQRDGATQEVELAAWSAPTWAVYQQCGAECEELAYRAAPELVRDAWIAVHRRFTGDDKALPEVVPESAVRVAGLRPAVAEDGVELAKGDLLLAIELRFRTDAGITNSLRPFKTVQDTYEFFNDFRSYDPRNPTSGYDLKPFDAFVYRDGKVAVVKVAARRLLY